jgi:serine/threonine protein kinase
MDDQMEGTPHINTRYHVQLDHGGLLGSGTYGRVYKGYDLQTNELVALKEIPLKKGDEQGFPITALREIKLLFRLRHENIIRVREIVHDGKVL